MIGMAAQEKKWQQESDARTLAEAEAIKADKNRLKGATKAASVMVKKAETEAKSFKKVASKSTSAKSVSTKTKKK